MTLPAKLLLAPLAASLVIAGVLAGGASADDQPRRKRVAEKVVAADAALVIGADASAAREAIGRLALVKNPTATKALSDGLALGLAPAVAQAALAALEARADAAAIPILTYYLKVRPKKLRAAATRAAASIASKEGDALIISALGDPTKEVRGVAAEMVAKRRLKSAASTLVAMLKAGEKSAGGALIAIADAEISRKVAETLGETPSQLLAETLGGILLRDDFGPDSLRVEVVRALAKIPGNAGTTQLATYLAETPAKPPRASRREAERLVGDNL